MICTRICTCTWCAHGQVQENHDTCIPDYTLVGFCHRKGYLHKREQALCDEVTCMGVTGNMSTDCAEAQ